MGRLLIWLTVLLPSAVFGASLDGTALHLTSAIPFAGILLSLALMPIFLPKFWHHHFGKIAAAWAVIALYIIWHTFGLYATLEEIVATYLEHFLPFVIFILALFVIAGGLKIDITTKATPLFNTLYLAFSGIAASMIGTTGAAMLFIHSFLNVNQHRDTRKHLVIFFIFIVCNIGGSLSAIGDPPLFLGFLNGIDFFWPTTHLFPPFVTTMAGLLGIFYLLDRYHYQRDQNPSGNQPIDGFALKVSGKQNIIFMVLAVIAIILSGVWKTNSGIQILATKISYPDLLRDIALLLLTIASLKFGNAAVRAANHFSWEPFMEVFKVFAAIFITAAPVLAMLKAGPEGSFAGIVAMVNGASGPDNEVYFWLTGILSAFLDNAPTYLVFFNLAGGNPEVLMTTLAKTLMAISTGSVFMGAMTYIGNAPNFMVKAIAEQNKIAMPSFFGYLGWAIAILLPLFYLTELLWIK
jgi:Na+/H+ antiporter NhaD/arsenite permease-like protein